MGEGEQLVGLSDSFFPLLRDLSHSYLTLLAPTRRPSPRLLFCCCEIRKQDLTRNEMCTYCKQTMRFVASHEREGRSRISSNLPEIAEPGQFVTWCLALWSSCFIVLRISMLLLQKSLFPSCAEPQRSPQPKKEQQESLSWAVVLDAVVFGVWIGSGAAGPPRSYGLELKASF